MAVFIIFGTQMVCIIHAACMYQCRLWQSQDVLRAWTSWLPSRGQSDTSSQFSMVKEPNWVASGTEVAYSLPEDVHRPPTPPPKDFVTISSSRPATVPFYNAAAAEPRTSHQDGSSSDVGSRPSSVDAAISLRSSLNSRKGDSVIIISKPEEAFRKLGEANAV